MFMKTLKNQTESTEDTIDKHFKIQADDNTLLNKTEGASSIQKTNNADIREIYSFSAIKVLIDWKNEKEAAEKENHIEKKQMQMEI